jgi:hypothetical protein
MARWGLSRQKKNSEQNGLEHRVCQFHNTNMLILTLKLSTLYAMYSDSQGAERSGIESRFGRNFLQPSSPALRLTQPPIEWVPGLSQW